MKSLATFMRMKRALALLVVLFSFLLLQGCHTPLISVNAVVTDGGVCSANDNGAGLCSAADVTTPGQYGNPPIQCTGGKYCTSTAGCPRGKTCTTVHSPPGTTTCACGCL